MKITEKIRYVGVNDRRDILFENQWPLPHGVALNSYLVIDEKTALIDTAAAEFADEFISNVRREAGERKIDYLIINVINRLDICRLFSKENCPRAEEWLKIHSMFRKVRYYPI